MHRFASLILCLALLACGPSLPGDNPDGGTGGPDGAVNTSCQPGSTPSPEVCDSIDNDCNQIVDDGLYLPNPNGCGVKVCHFGEWVDYVDDVGGVQELCNNHDDDCDGQIDENLSRPDPNTSCTQICVNGQWVGGSNGADDPCDGIDNDCDGQIDEDFSPELCLVTCGTGGSFSFTQCLDGREVCAPVDWPISLELCDGIDNDCDGLVDEGIPPRPCPCGSGRETCTNGHWSGCASGCVLGTRRWCDEPQYCYWGRQTCVSDPDGVGRWGDCTETPDRPAGCAGNVYDPDCCVAAGECCQDAFDSWESVGNCGQQCP